VELGELGLRLAAAVGVDEGVREDAEEPRLQIRARRELLTETESPYVGLLHQILRVGLRSGHAQGGAVQRVQEAQRFGLERVAAHLPTLPNVFGTTGHSRYSPDEAPPRRDPAPPAARIRRSSAAAATRTARRAHPHRALPEHERHESRPGLRRSAGALPDL